MRATLPRFPSLQALAFGVVALGAVVGAWDVQAPDRATPPTMPANTPIVVAGATAKGSNIRMAFFPDSVAATNKPWAIYQTRVPITFKARPADSATVAREKGATRTRDKHDTIPLIYYRKNTLSLSVAFPIFSLPRTIPSIADESYAYPKPTNGFSSFKVVKSTKH